MAAGSTGQNCTTVPVFADTNIVVYAFSKDDAKIAVAEGILELQPTISVQVVSEFLNLCRVKLGIEIETEGFIGCTSIDKDSNTSPPPLTDCTSTR